MKALEIPALWITESMKHLKNTNLYMREVRQSNGRVLFQGCITKYEYEGMRSHYDVRQEDAHTVVYSRRRHQEPVIPRSQSLRPAC